MLAGVPKLFGRGFLVGFILPAALFQAYLAYALRLDLFGMGSANTAAADALARAAIAVVGLALLLLVLNRPIVRGLEGYGDLNPLRLVREWQRRRFDAALKAVEEADATMVEGVLPAEDVAEARAALVSRFPHQRELVLPTRFGNAYRAHESYPTVIYSMDAVVLWPRLLCVIPETALEQLQDARALLDFKVNMFVLTVLAGIAACATFSSFIHGVAAAVALVLAICLWCSLPAAVIAWGRAFGSTFDLYRAALAEKLGLELPTELETERLLWDAVSGMILFRSAENAEYLDHFRVRKSSGSADPDPSTPKA